MRKRWRWVAGVAALFFLYVLTYSDEYSAEAIEAVVVDEVTGRPIAGVYVVVDWQLKGGIERGNQLGALKVLEAQTDSAGRFRIPSWGPIKAQITAPWYYQPRLEMYSPNLLLFKPGYEYLNLANFTDVESRRGMRSVWTGTTIKLKPFVGTSEESASRLESISSQLESRTAPLNFCHLGARCPEACQWENVPMTIRALGAEAKLLKAKDMKTVSLYEKLIEDESVYRQLGCASVRKVLGKL